MVDLSSHLHTKLSIGRRIKESESCRTFPSQFCIFIWRGTGREGGRGEKERCASSRHTDRYAFTRVQLQPHSTHFFNRRTDLRYTCRNALTTVLTSALLSVRYKLASM